MWQKFKILVVYYPTLAWNVLLGRILRIRNWWDRVDEHMIIGALPFASDISKLASEGVTAVVNTCMESAGPVSEYEKHNIRQLRIPTIDFTHPQLVDVEKAVAFINKEVEKGGSVYVHCKAGRARSATVVMCWLIDHKKMTPHQAQQLLLEKRPHVNPKVEFRPVVKAFVANRKQ